MKQVLQQKVEHYEVKPVRGKNTAIIRGDKLTATDEKRERIQHSQPVFQEMVDKWGLKGNDIFATPDIAYEYMSAMLGEDVTHYHDPCPAFLEYPDGTPVPDGMTSLWKSPAFCNPLFSLAYEWLEKMVQEAERSVVVIALFNQPSYFVVEGRERQQKWQEWKGSSSL